MPFIKDAKTGLPGYTMPDFEEEEEQAAIAKATQDQSPDPSIYGEPGVTAAEVRDRNPIRDPDFDEVERRVNAPGMLTEEQYARANALATAVEHGGFQTPEAAVRRASIYAAYIKDGTVPPADGLPPPEQPKEE